MKKILIALAFLGITFQQSDAQVITPVVKTIKVANHNRQTGILDTLSYVYLTPEKPNLEFTNSALGDSVQKCLQTVVLPKLNKSATFTITCATFPYLSTDTIKTYPIGKVLFVSPNTTRKIFATAVTGAAATYTAQASTKSVTTLNPGYQITVRFKYLSDGVGTYYISSPVQIY